MPWIVDYAQVLEQMRAQGLKGLYFNSGAFGFGDSTSTESVGWMGPDDPTLRPDARARTRSVSPPYPRRLTQLLVRAWQTYLPGKVWLMPRSHWAYELDYGSRDWLPALLEHAGVDAGLLQPRSDAAAIEFALAESVPFSHVAEGLLRMLLGSDFALAFPGRPVVCTLHHHKQVWWTSSDPPLVDALRRMADE